MARVKFRRSMDKKLYAAILAAGESKRMKSEKSKVLHKLCGKPLLYFPIEVAKSLNPEEIFVVVGGRSEKEVRETFKDSGVTFVTQEEPNGTGGAVMELEPFFEDKEADIFIIPGDAPLLRRETAQELVRFHQDRGAIATVLTAEVPDPTGYGRIIRSIGDRILMIVEEADAFPEEKAIREVNSGMYVFDTYSLFRWLNELRPNNKQEEFYLTDVIEILQRRLGGVFAYKVPDYTEILGVNTRKQLAEANRIMNDRLKVEHMEKGVTFIDPNTVYLEVDVEIGKDTIIFPFVSLLGKTEIGEKAEIGPNVTLKDVKVTNGKVVRGNNYFENQVI